MKKSLIALAAMAAVGAASAQSSVTLYGIIDAGVGITRTKTPAGLTSTDIGGRRSELSGSRWGLKGQEDLGNGLSAVFQIESGFDGLTGGDANPGFNRRATVGLSGGFGEVLIGHKGTPIDGISDFVAVGEVATGSFYTGEGTGIHYSGTFSGVSIAAFAGAVSDTDEFPSAWMGSVKSERKDKGYSAGLSIGYETGPFAILGAVHASKSDRTWTWYNAAGVITWGPFTTPNNRTIEYAVGASYDFTSAKLFAHYVGQKVTGNPVMQQMGVGVTVPFGAFGLGAQYAYNKQGAGDSHNFALRGTYDLSKRTRLYAQASRRETIAVGNGTRRDDFSVGIRHSF